MSKMQMEVEQGTVSLPAPMDRESSMFEVRDRVNQDIKKEEEQAREIELQNKVFKDKGPEAKAGRLRTLLKATWGEFMCTLFFLTPILGIIARGTLDGWSGESIAVTISFVAALQGTSCIYTWGSISGANFNPAVSFALWSTGKLSNRKFVLYVMAQCMASIMATVIIAITFSGNMNEIYDALAVVPPADSHPLKLFLTEFWLTFVLVYVAFTNIFEDAEKERNTTMTLKTISDAKGLTLFTTNPQSKTGFAPIAIGFAIFGLATFGGSSGGCFNPARIVGPALFSNKGKQLWVYLFGEFLGAAAAGGMVHNFDYLSELVATKIFQAPVRGASVKEDSSNPMH